MAQWYSARLEIERSWFDSRQKQLPKSAFCADSYFGIRSTPCTAAVRKDPGHSTKVTAKHACTLPMWLPLTL